MTILYTISPYGICGALGFIMGIVYLLFACKKHNKNFYDIVYVYVWSALGAMFGAKILYLVIELRNIVIFLQDNSLSYHYIQSVLTGGFVFYGGLIGALVVAYNTCRYFRYNVNEVLPVIIPTMPLAHAFGRIGCAIVGCCYGIEITDGFGIVYQHSEYAPLGVTLFPVQLIEALGDIIIFSLLCCIIFIERYKKYKANIFPMYIFLYAIMRFILEFFRGDFDRGFLLGVSTSQWISIIFVLYVLVNSIRCKHNSEDS